MPEAQPPKTRAYKPVYLHDQPWLRGESRLSNQGGNRGSNVRGTPKTAADAGSQGPILEVPIKKEKWQEVFLLSKGKRRGGITGGVSYKNGSFETS